ncbi:MarR family winged helix-turn-helix transcriptional regulator [Basilea psittacipulmonis]|uniref:MarR family winged helix-turn-helix transcriptional regulator n=1 Tax=Basilea psittacipulmonis TaxID=1472345 RepID=UPI00068A1ED3|nr:MarR family transcriptional regulator [Basilea psittacipulmonis]
MLTFEDYLDMACKKHAKMPRLDVFVSGHIVRAAREGRRKLNEKLRPYDLTATHYWVLMFLASGSEKISPSSLCELVDISRTKMTRVISDLEEMGFVERIPNRADRRSLYLEINKRGRKRLDELSPIVSQVYSNMWDPLTEDEKRQLVQTLSKITLSL